MGQLIFWYYFGKTTTGNRTQGRDVYLVLQRAESVGAEAWRDFMLWAVQMICADPGLKAQLLAEKFSQWVKVMQMYLHATQTHSRC